MLGSKSATVALLHLFLLFLGPASAAPTDLTKRTEQTSYLRLARDGDNLSQSTTVTTTSTLQTAVGAMIQTCTITLDPITGNNGEPLVRETKSCTVSMASSGNNAAGNGGSNSSSADSGSSSTDSSAATSTDSSAATSTDSTGATATATDSNSATATASSGSPGGVISVDGTTLVSGTALPSGSTDTATGTGTASGPAATTTGGAVSPGGFSSIDSGAIATESVESGSASGTATVTSAGASGSAVGDASGTATSAADSASSSAATFQLPGTKLSVLPIGLGVFAGISVIALIVVGLVTYERTKYRRAFRQRKLAESGAGMGYGGMA
ncbi:hypothetical protein BD309DRAFT_990082 [Dichomitus squalens]|uniref:Uncharacterized protein n=1 Tax=Dichomitus squalens TaxID=114155 RepID=A0A4Q9NST6_9APHY|nr:hypothetical protein BD309DRAFT_990082 [Dichomitus squalens]TBU56899.1 hypothetical protein BD310DRAFT_949776 [Dichomitus squalens]